MEFLRYVRIVVRTLFAVVNNLYCIPAYVVWMMALRIVRPLSAPLYWKIEGLMYHWLLAMVSMWSWTAGYENFEQYILDFERWSPAAGNGYRPWMACAILTFCDCVVYARPPEDGR